MSKIIFVLGAGASHHCGTPLMKDFFETARELWAGGEVSQVSEHFERVDKALGLLHEVQSKAILDVDNVENAFTAFEMGRLLGRLPGIEDIGEIEKLESSLKKVIGYTLERTTRLPKDDKGNVSAPQPYYKFAEIIASLIEVKKDCSIISFNYDLGLDYSLKRRGLSPDYGLGENRKSNSITYLKLHGSLNWGRCKKCLGIITPYMDLQSTEGTIGRKYNILSVISKLGTRTCKNCGYPLEEDPCIIPPTWNKTAQHLEIGQVWKRAAKELKDVEEIFVLGYSLPNTDWFFNHLYALGVDMRTPIKGFHVYNTDLVAEARFRNLLGQSVIRKFEFHNVTFEEAVDAHPVIKNYYRSISRLLNLA